MRSTLSNTEEVSLQKGFFLLFTWFNGLQWSINSKNLPNRNEHIKAVTALIISKNDCYFWINLAISGHRFCHLLSKKLECKKRRIRQSFKQKFLRNDKQKADSILRLDSNYTQIEPPNRLKHNSFHFPSTNSVRPRRRRRRRLHSLTACFAVRQIPLSNLLSVLPT